MIAQAATLLLMMSDPSAGAGALVEIAPSGELIVPAYPAAPRALYQVRFDRTEYSAPLAVQIERAVEPEPFDIVEADESAGAASVRTTEWGGFKLQLHSASVSPQVEAITARCSRVHVELDLDPQDQERADPPELFASNRPCPGATIVYPQRALILEGLSSNGRRLWTATAPDPRWRRLEEQAAGGTFELGFAGHVAEPVLFAGFFAPITEALDRIAWHEIRADGEVVKLGESRWSLAPTEASPDASGASEPGPAQGPAVEPGRTRP